MRWEAVGVGEEEVGGWVGRGGLGVEEDGGEKRDEVGVLTSVVDG